jgi:hypothetical protein
MRLLSTDSKLWWLAKPDEIRASSGIPIVQAIKRIVEEFQFAQAPMTLPGPNDGYKFQEGRFVVEARPIAIKEFVIFNDGLSLEIYSDTNDNLRLLERVLEVGAELGLRKPISPPIQILQSLIVVDYPGPIDKLAANFETVSKTINEKIGIPGQHQLRAIEFAVDPASLPRQLVTLNPTVFRIERRINTEYELNRFFSFANTHTENHIYILEKIESLISK